MSDWVSLPNKEQIAPGFYLIKNVADDGDGVFGEWVTVGKWTGRVWHWVGSCADSRSEEWFEHRHDADRAKEECDV